MRAALRRGNRRCRYLDGLLLVLFLDELELDGLREELRSLGVLRQLRQDLFVLLLDLERLSEESVSLLRVLNQLLLLLYELLVLYAHLLERLLQLSFLFVLSGLLPGRRAGVPGLALVQLGLELGNLLGEARMLEPQRLVLPALILQLVEEYLLRLMHVFFISTRILCLLRSSLFPVVRNKVLFATEHAIPVV